MDDVLILFIEKNSRHPSCICFPEIDRFFAFVNSEKSAWTDGKNEPKPCGENMKVFLERNV